MTSQLKNPHNAIFNIHVPPYKSNLDEAPELDKNLRPVLAGNSMKPVGSTALRAVDREGSAFAWFAWTHPRRTRHIANWKNTLH